MKRVRPEPNWPESWRYSYAYDLQEVYGEITGRGYAYAYANRREVTLQLLGEVMPEGARILDLAAAQGNFTLALAERGYRVTWNDLRGELEGYVRLKHESGEVVYAPGNAFQLSFAEPFDAVLATEIIEHVAHPDEFLCHAARLLKPGGFLVLTTPNGAYFRNALPRFSECQDASVFEVVQFKPDSDGHIFLLHADEMRMLGAKAGLRVDCLKLFTNPLTNGHVKTEWLLKFLPRSFVRSLERATQALPARMQVQMGVRFQKETSSSEARSSPLHEPMPMADGSTPHPSPLPSEGRGD